ncbi:MAG: hypothetical protein JWR26_757 [Pedosphaera sp.]|nr:hypothetical protein [Pedosphaera sp.]
MARRDEEISGDWRSLRNGVARGKLSRIIAVTIGGFGAELPQGVALELLNPWESPAHESIQHPQAIADET